MKAPLILTILLIGSSASQANPVARKLVSKALEKAGRETLETGAREAAEHAAAAAIRKFGAEGAEELVQRGGLELLEAGAKHGDGILKAARRVPEATRYLAARPAEALTLVTRYGDDALRLEARVPGMAEQAIAQFGRGELAVFAKAPSSEITQLIGYAARADNPATRRALLESWKKNGSFVLRELDKHKVLILTGGLTVSMIMTADGVQDAVQDLPEKVPDAIRDFTGKVGAGLASCLGILSLGGVTVLGWWAWLRRPIRKA